MKDSYYAFPKSNSMQCRKEYELYAGKHIALNFCRQLISGFPKREAWDQKRKPKRCTKISSSPQRDRHLTWQDYQDSSQNSTSENDHAVEINVKRKYVFFRP